MESLKELLEFLDLKARLDLKAVALQHVSSMTGSAKNCELLLSLSGMLERLILLVQDDSVAIAKEAALSLVNITADEQGAIASLHISETTQTNPHQEPNCNLINICLRHIIDKDSSLADACCMILCNMTRPFILVEKIVMLIESSEYTWDTIISVFTTQKYNRKDAKLHYIGPMFSNLSQSTRVRRYLMDRDLCAIQRLLPFTEYVDSTVRRGGVVGTLRNCCFDTEHHEWLLSTEIDILSHLLLPLAGPEEFDDEDNDKLPIDLQYLPENKMREPDPDIRIMLLETLAQLCATKRGREILREKNTYVILRELHKWEKDKAALLACEKVVDILIRTEEEIGLDNLKEIEVPLDYEEKFHKMDQDFIKDLT